MNLTNLAVSLLVANAVSRNTVGLGAWDFLTAGTSLNSRKESGYLQSGDNWKKMITLQEMLAGKQAGSSSTGAPIGEAIMDNLKENWLPLTASIVGIPAAAKVATKMLRKPILTPLNRVIKSTGLDVKV